MTRLNHTVDQTHIRSINQRVILDSIYHAESISRAALSRLVHISKSAMTENIAALLNIGIIEEVGAGRAMPTGGRKPILLKFNKNYKYIVAIDLNYEEPIFVLANLGGERINHFTINITPATSFATRLELVKNAIATLTASGNLANTDLAVIAISSPGIYLPESREFRANTQFTNWKIPELSQALEETFGTPVLIVNDVNAAAVGELNYGIGTGKRNLVYFSCGLGVGAGIIIDGALYEGSGKSAGEVANFLVHSPDGPVPLEKYIGLDALLQRVRDKAPAQTLHLVTKETGAVSFRKVTAAWQAGDPFIRACIDEIAGLTGTAISNIISLLNCDLVILGGEYHVFASQMLPIINSIVQEHAFSPVPVVASGLSRDSGIFGLFALSNEIIFNRLCGRSNGGNRM